MTPEPPPAHRPAGPRGHARAAAFLAFALFIVAGPIGEQTFRVRHPVLRGWQMFGTEGLDATQARFFTIGAGGVREDLDRYAILTPGQPLPPRKDRRIADVPAARRIARTLCRRLGAGADVRVELTTATRRGWTIAEDGATNECTRLSERGAPTKEGG